LTFLIYQGKNDLSDRGANMKKWIFILILLLLIVSVSIIFIVTSKVDYPGCEQITLKDYVEIIKGFKWYCYTLTALTAILLGFYKFKQTELNILKGKEHPRKKLIISLFFWYILILVLSWGFYLVGREKTWLSLDATKCESFGQSIPAVSKVLSFFGWTDLPWLLVHSLDLLLIFVIFITISYKLSIFLSKKS
jgi:hypothetical protein